VELGETLHEAVVRETAEETGLEVVVDRFLGWVERMGDGEAPAGERYHFVILDFAVTVLEPGTEPVAGDDAAEVAWVPSTSSRTSGSSPGSTTSCGTRACLPADWSTPLRPPGQTGLRNWPAPLRLLGSCAHRANLGGTMFDSQHKQRVTEFLAATKSGDRDRLRSLVTDDIAWWVPKSGSDRLQLPIPMIGAENFLSMQQDALDTLFQRSHSR